MDKYGVERVLCALCIMAIGLGGCGGGDADADNGDGGTENGGNNGGDNGGTLGTDAATEAGSGGSDAGMPGVAGDGGQVATNGGAPSCDDDCCPTITGTVYNPSGELPLSNVRVFVPEGEVEPIEFGVDGDACVATSALVETRTDVAGTFALEGVPTGDTVPVVMEVGKWRRQVQVAVNGCEAAELPESASHLPRNRAEGDIPQIAMVTGGADSLECFLRKLGIDDAEFTHPDDEGRVHMYQGYGIQGGFQDQPWLGDFVPSSDGSTLPEGAPRADELWASFGSLSAYDVAVLACEGSENNVHKPQSARQAMSDYLDAGGRVFATHFHYVWFRDGVGDLPDVAEWENTGSSPEPTYRVVDNHARGAVFSDWLQHIGASTERGYLDLEYVRTSLSGVDERYSTPWIYGEEPFSVKVFTFGTPLDAAPEARRGRTVFSDVHISDGIYAPSNYFPDLCDDEPLTAQEAALGFLWFELFACP